MTDFGSTARTIQQQLQRAERILLIGHRRPDADALGSLQAFGGWVRQLGKSYVSFCLQRTGNPSLDFLTDFEPYATAEAVAVQDFDLVVVFDSGDLSYAGVDALIPRLAGNPPLMNIDHHVTNAHYGAVNLVDAQAASTTEILYQLFEELRVAITPEMANALLAGIIGDTYNFTNPNTRYTTLGVAARLLGKGANLKFVSQAVLQNKPLSAMQFWGSSLLRLQYNEQLGVASLVITQQDLEELSHRLPPGAGDANEVTEGVTNFLNNLGGVSVALVLRELPDGTVRGSLRTNDDLIDVSHLAKMLGGGGHRKAAGFTVAGQIQHHADGGWQIV